MSDLFCRWCGSDTFTVLGRLGSLVWFRCRSCGADSNLPASEVPEDVYEEVV